MSLPSHNRSPANSDQEDSDRSLGSTGNNSIARPPIQSRAAAAAAGAMANSERLFSTTTDLGGLGADFASFVCDSDSNSDLLTLVQSYDWAATLARIASHPAEAANVGVEGRTALHLACDHDAPDVVVHALLAAHPAAALSVGTSDMNPLHITCSSQHASVHVVRVLLEGSDAQRVSAMKDVDGDTPLHAACRCGAPIEVLELLLCANPSVVNERDKEGLTPLLRLWVRYFVTLGDDVIDAVTGPDDLVGELAEAWNKTLLLLAAAHYGTLDVLSSPPALFYSSTVLADMNAALEAAHSESNSDGGSVEAKTSLGDTNSLTSLQLRLLEMQQQQHLHNCEKDPKTGNPESSQDAAFLFLFQQQLSHGLMQTNSKEYYTSSQMLPTFRPIHAAAAVDCPRSVVKIATVLYQDQINTFDETGRNPLMIAAMAPIYKVHDLSDEGYCIEDQIHGDDIYHHPSMAYDYSVHDDSSDNVHQYDSDTNSFVSSPSKEQPSVIEILLSASKAAAATHDNLGLLPLNLAIASGKSWNEGVKQILEAAPDAITSVDPFTGLYPFMLAAIVGVRSRSSQLGDTLQRVGLTEYEVASDRKQADCNTIYELLKRNPELVRRGNEHYTDAGESVASDINASDESADSDGKSADGRNLYYHPDVSALNSTSKGVNSNEEALFNNSPAAQPHGEGSKEEYFSCFTSNEMLQRKGQVSKESQVFVSSW